MNMDNYLNNNTYYNDFIKTTQKFNEFKNRSIPLCSAENAVSKFVRLPLLSSAQEKYVMGGCLEYINDDNFIGGETIYPYYYIINRQCNLLFNSNYADARTLSGMNSVTTLLMSITQPGDTVAITCPDCGGHASIPDICHRLGLKTIDLPFNYDNFELDYYEINKTINEQKISAILISLSDIIAIPNFSKIDLSKEVPIIYDATQTLGLIAGSKVKNPFEDFDDMYPFILMGATHKTIPGPSASLIMTRNLFIANKIEKRINPMFIRNTQMNQKMSLILALLEMEYFGKEYSDLIVSNANCLSKLLLDYSFNVPILKNAFTETHQVFFCCSEEEMKEFYKNCDYYNITLNFKTKKLFKQSGIRIGTQEVSRYNWNEDDLTIVSKVLNMLMEHPAAYKNINIDKQIEELLFELRNKKTISFTFKEEFYEQAFKNVRLWIE